MLQNSNTNAQFRLLFSAPLLGGQPPVAAGPGQLTPGLAIEWLRTGRPEVTSLRQAVGADFVALFVPGDQNINCGAADISGAGAYAVIDLDCAPGDYVVAHELGHLLGLRHPATEYTDFGVAVPASPYPFAFGFDADNQLVVNGRRAATVVACNGTHPDGQPINTLTGIQCNRLPTSPARTFR